MTRDEAFDKALEQYMITVPHENGRAAFLRSLAASGYAVVPVEATEKMCDEARNAADSALLSDEWFENVYRAMLTAAQEDSHE